MSWAWSGMTQASPSPQESSFRYVAADMNVESSVLFPSYVLKGAEQYPGFYPGCHTPARTHEHH